MNLSLEQRATQEILSRGWVQHMVWRQQLDSTSSEARRWVETHPHPALPALFVADVQTSGRGRSGHQWWSPSGCLMLTLAIGGELLPRDPGKWCELALVCGVATAETVAGFLDPRDEGQQVKLKWPNDIYLAERKCGGILIESAAWDAPRVCNGAEQPSPLRSAWLIGIGLNVAIDWELAPQVVAGKATCLKRYSHQNIQLATVLVELIANLYHWISGWSAGELQWQDAWRERCLLSGRVIRVRAPNGTESLGLCEGVDANGHLILRQQHGVELRNTGEIVSW